MSALTESSGVRLLMNVAEWIAAKALTFDRNYTVTIPNVHFRQFWIMRCGYYWNVKRCQRLVHSCSHKLVYSVTCPLDSCIDLHWEIRMTYNRQWNWYRKRYHQQESQNSRAERLWHITWQGEYIVVNTFNTKTSLVNISEDLNTDYSRAHGQFTTQTIESTLSTRFIKRREFLVSDH